MRRRMTSLALAALLAFLLAGCAATVEDRIDRLYETERAGETKLEDLAEALADENGTVRATAARDGRTAG